MGDSLKIIHFNTQGFHNKVDSINSFVQTHKPDVLVVTEHFQKSRDDLERIDGYRIVNSFCRRHRERGGVAIFARHGLPCIPRRDLDRHRRESELELVSVAVGEGEDVVVTGAYRPPAGRLADFHDHLLRVVKKINQEPHIKHVLAGDFNVDNSRPNRTRTVLSDHDLQFQLTSRTHRAGRCIDNFITNFEAPAARVLRTRGVFSDHQPIEITVPQEAESISKTPNSRLFKSLLDLFWDGDEGRRKTYAANSKALATLPRTKHVDKDRPKYYKMFMKILEKRYKSPAKLKRSRGKTRSPFTEQRTRPPSTKRTSRSPKLEWANENVKERQEEEIPKAEPESKSLFSHILSFFRLDWLISPNASNMSPDMESNSRGRRANSPQQQVTPADPRNIFVKIFTFLYKLIF